MLTPPASAVSFENLPVAGLLLDLGGAIVLANRVAARTFERTTFELAHLKLHALAPNLTRGWQALLFDLRENGELVDDVTIDLPSGRRDFQLAFALASTDDAELIQVYAVDITAHRSEDAEAEPAQVGEGADSFQASTHQRLLESLGLVAGGIAHDFNNLLVGVLAEASAAREDRSLSEPTREALRRIEAAARRMAQLTRQLLAYSGRGQFVTVPVGADALVEELQEQLVRLVRADATLDIATGAPAAVVEADPGLLRQVVVALASNASDAGGARVGITTRTISRDGTPFWQLEVSDDGAGIDTATLARIFEPFFTTKRDRHGLGLSAVHGIVRRLGGDIEVDTRVGRGSRFRVHLPIALGAEPPARKSIDAIAPPPKLVGVRVLVADDEPSVRATVRRLLERRGAVVVVAADGLEAEARLRDEPFHLVVSDVMMPGCTGYDVLVTARATQPGVRVVLMSGYTEKTRGQGGEEEPDAFIEKPFTAKALDAAIDEVLKGKR